MSIENKNEVKAAPAAPAQTSPQKLLKFFANQVVEEAAAKGWAMKDESPFEDSVREAVNEALKSPYTRAAIDGSVAAPVQAEQARAEPLVFDDFPEFNAQAMGCGLEDRGITDRYDAMRYGFEEALDLVDERIKNFLADLALPAQAEQVEAVRAAYENAAKVADGFYDHIRQYTTDVPAIGSAIRALAAPSTATSNDTGALGDTGGAK